MHGDDFNEDWDSPALPSGFVPISSDEGDVPQSTGTDLPPMPRSRSDADLPDDKYKRRQEVQRRYREKVKARAAEREAALESARREIEHLRTANAALTDMVSALEKLDSESSALTAVLSKAGPRVPRAATDPHSTLPALDALQLATYSMNISFNPSIPVSDQQLLQFLSLPPEVLTGFQIEFIRRLEQHMQEWAVCYSSRPKLEVMMASGMRNRFRMLRLMNERAPDIHIKVMKKVAVPPGSPAAIAAAQRMAAIVAQLGLSEAQRAALEEALRQFKDSINTIRADAAMAQMTLASLAEMGGMGAPMGGPGGGAPPGMPGLGAENPLPPQLAEMLGAGPAGAAGRRNRRVSARAAAAAETAALIGEEPSLARAASSGSEGSGYGSATAGGFPPPRALPPGGMVSMVQRAQDALAATDAVATLQRLPYRMLHARTVITVQTLGALTPVQAAKVILGCRPAIPDHALLCEVATAGMPPPPMPAGPPQPGPPRPGQLPWPFN